MMEKVGKFHFSSNGGSRLFCLVRFVCVASYREFMECFWVLCDFQTSMQCSEILKALCAIFRDFLSLSLHILVFERVGLRGWRTEGEGGCRNVLDNLNEG